MATRKLSTFKNEKHECMDYTLDPPFTLELKGEKAYYVESKYGQHVKIDASRAEDEKEGLDKGLQAVSERLRKIAALKAPGKTLKPIVQVSEYQKGDEEPVTYKSIFLKLNKRQVSMCKERSVMNIDAKIVVSGIRVPFNTTDEKNQVLVLKHLEDLKILEAIPEEVEDIEL